MVQPLLRRNVTGLAREIQADSPAMVISGARQVGKSTLLQQLVAGQDVRVVNLDLAADRLAAERDPDGFAMQYPGGILAIDEIQRVPTLMTSLKAAIDSDRRPGRFVVTGSTDLLALPDVRESLAGRAQTVALEGLSRGEMAGRVEDFATYVWGLAESGTPQDSFSYSRGDYLQLAVTTGFPELLDARPRSVQRWLDNYVQRVLSKDTTDIVGVAYPDRLTALISLIAARNAGEFVAARVAREIDVPSRSIPAYLRALESVFLVRQLPAWSANAASRAVRTPKVMLADTGLAAHLAAVDAAGLERAVSSTLTGGLLEGFVVGELAKQRSWSATAYTISHFRDNHQREVDVVLEDRRRTVVGVEVKATVSVTGRDFRGLEFLRDQLGERFVTGVLLYAGSRAMPMGDRLWALPIATLWSH